MVHASPAIRSATTVSGTMVFGLTPVFTLWWWERPGPASYLSSLLVGLTFGLGLALEWIPGSIGDGPYGNLLLVNVLGIACCYVVFVALAWWMPRASEPAAKRPCHDPTRADFPSRFARSDIPSNWMDVGTRGGRGMTLLEAMMAPGLGGDHRQSG